jgi:hypothetical protein
VVKFTPRPLYTGKEPRASELVWKVWRREEPLASNMTQIPYLPARSLVAIPTAPVSFEGHSLVLVTYFRLNLWKGNSCEKYEIFIWWKGVAEAVVSLWFSFITSKCFSFRTKSKSLFNWHICSLVSRVLLKPEFVHCSQSRFEASFLTRGPVCLVAMVLVFTVYMYTIYRVYTKEWWGFNIFYYWHRTILLCIPCT